MKTKKISILALLIGIIVTLVIREYNLSNQLIKNPIFSGSTMGTTYSIKIVDEITPEFYEEINSWIKSTLYHFNIKMSTWIEDSEISKFNNSRSLEMYEIDKHFFYTVDAALNIAETSGGYYDPTIQPLYDLWGFGSGSTEDQVNNFPSSNEISSILNNIGYEKISTGIGKYGLFGFEFPYIQKNEPNITINLGGIAKGAAAEFIVYNLCGDYWMDMIVNYSEEEIKNINYSSGDGFQNYCQFKNIYVDIGGDVAALGLNQDGLPWKIGIQTPSSSLFDVSSLYGIINITNGSLATSGNYFNYKEKDNQKYAHILNPKTGMSIKSNIVSVSVYHPNAAYSDGFATAIYVMGLKKGLEMVESLPNTEAMIIVKDKNGLFHDHFSSQFISKTNYKKINY